MTLSELATELWVGFVSFWGLVWVIVDHYWYLMILVIFVAVLIWSVGHGQARSSIEGEGGPPA